MIQRYMLFRNCFERVLYTEIPARQSAGNSLFDCSEFLSYPMKPTPTPRLQWIKIIDIP
jgi:hypothetical protein